MQDAVKQRTSACVRRLPLAWPRLGHSLAATPAKQTYVHCLERTALSVAGA